MSTTCKYEYYCNIQKQRQKTSCLAVRAQMLAFQERMLAEQWVARQQQISDEYYLCVAACGCDPCDCATQCADTRTQVFAFFENKYNTDLQELQASFTCCDEQYCTQEGDTAYQICCDTNGPIGTTGRPDVAQYAGIYTPVRDYGIKGTPVISNFIVAQSRNSQNSGSAIVIYKPPTGEDFRYCINKMITASVECRNQAYADWEIKDIRIERKLKEDLQYCYTEYVINCRNTSQEQQCKIYYEICAANARAEAENATKINDEDFRRKTGREPGIFPDSDPPSRPCAQIVCCVEGQRVYEECLKGIEAPARGLEQSDTKSAVKYPY